MFSIKSKFITLVLASILLSAAIIGGVSLWSIGASEKESSDQILLLSCEREGENLDSLLKNVENAVGILSDTVIEGLPSVDKLADPDFLSVYLAEIDTLVDNVGRNTEGVIAHYVRFAPELTPYEAGVLYARNFENYRFSRVPLTDLSAYSPDDDEHVGWYYKPLRAHGALWLEPYQNKNLDVFMISYVKPLYKSGSFIGVAGMDIDFRLVETYVKKITPFSSTHSFLVSPDATMVYYHPDFEAGSSLVDDERFADIVAEALKLEGKGTTDGYSYEGDVRRAAFYSLRNDMMLVLSVAVDEINEHSDRLEWVIITIAALIAILFSVLALIITARITRPLNTLTKAAEEIYRGNLDVEFDTSGRDEVGILARTMASTVGRIRERFDIMLTEASTDPLTGVKNRKEFEKTMNLLRERMEEGDYSFALLLFDLNNLKKINDLHGHDRGDDYICGSCAMICRSFEHSPVYRIGGDEFIVLLEGIDLLRADILIENLDREMEEAQNNEKPWERYSLAKGLCRSSDGAATPDEIFSRADKAMYEDKRRMKMCRE